MESDKIDLGQVVYSKAGRDKGKYFLVIGMMENGYALISDGDTRKLEKPKRKKIKHLVIYNMIAYDIKEKIDTGIKITNGDLRNSLKSLGLINQSN